jgi:deoxyadenosine/deoxycytidine kinase
MAAPGSDSVGLYIQVDGNLGAGKSFFIENILCPSLKRLGLHPLVIREPVEKWREILPLFYADMKRWAYTLQTKVVFDRTQEVKKIFKEAQELVNYGKTIVFVSERGVLSDHFFAETLHEREMISPIEMASYEDWWSMWTKLVPATPDVIYFLTTDFEVCCNRIVERSRKGEELIDKDYLRHLLANHNRAYLGKKTYAVTANKQAKVLEVDFSRNLIEFLSFQDQIIRQLTEHDIPFKLTESS